MEKLNYQDSIAALKESTMFHMSLGSKELFHSNFLHWISIVNWDAFLRILHGLAGTEEFWWEKDGACKVNGYNKYYCPENKNLEVRREYHHFDLSIYILDSEKEKEEVGDTADKDTLEYCHNAKGSRIVQKWIPVLILENKMKSLPYRGQLVEYTHKAFEEWRTGKMIKDALNGPMDSKSAAVSKEWNAEHGVTFILLSLMNSSLGQNGEQDFLVSETLEYKRASESLTFEFQWKHRTYRELYSFLSIKDNNNRISEKELKLDQLIIDDYASFLESFCNLADCWKINPDLSFRDQIAPWGMYHDKDNEIIKELEDYKKLRIHDIHEKLLYDQLLVALESELQHQGINWKRYNSKTNRSSFEDGIRVFTKSDYAHGVGIFEAQYFIFQSNKLEESFLKLIIQVQGERYCHMVICDGIAKGAKRVQEEMKNELGNKISNVWDNMQLNGIDQTLNQYISVNKSTPLFKWRNTEPEWGKYGENNLYQYIVIPHKATVQNVIEAIVEDITKINTWFK